MNNETQKTAVQLIFEAFKSSGRGGFAQWLHKNELILKEMDKVQIGEAYVVGVQDKFYFRCIRTGMEYFEETYGSSNQLCCTPEGQIKRYVNCIGCDRKPLIQGGNK
jgi:hypothetical protein